MPTYTIVDKMSTCIDEFCVEILLQIFQYCDIKDLCRLKQTCKRFNVIINKYEEQLVNQDLLVTNESKNSIRNRTLTPLNCFEKWRIYSNWKIGRYKLTKLISHRQKYMPWLHLDKQYLWISQGKYLKYFSRNPKRIINKRPNVIHNGLNKDIVRFRVKDNYVISGLRNGGIWIWSLEKNKFLIDHSHNNDKDVTDVDIAENFYVSSSVDTSYSIWNFKQTNVDLVHRQLIHDKIWCLNISPCSQYLALGSAGFFSVPPFHVHDIERHCSLFKFPPARQVGAGILDLHWENSTTVLTCGYDSKMRQWDLRSGRCEHVWMDPFDAAFYCLASDDLYSVFTGTNMHGRAILWDQRMTNTHIQMYFTTNYFMLQSSPVYGISFDSSHLFTAVDHIVACFDFSINNTIALDYSSI